MASNRQPLDRGRAVQRMPLENTGIKTAIIGGCLIGVPSFASSTLGNARQKGEVRFALALVAYGTGKYDFGCGHIENDSGCKDAFARRRFTLFQTENPMADFRQTGAHILERSVILLAEDEEDYVLLIKKAFEQAKILNPLHIVSTGSGNDGVFEGRWKIFQS